METPKEILIGWITSSWLQSTWTARQVADGFLNSLNAAGYVIVKKEPTDAILKTAGFCDEPKGEIECCPVCEYDGVWGGDNEQQKLKKGRRMYRAFINALGTRDQ